MAPTAMERATTMKAIVRDKYGSPDVLELQEVEKPELTDDGVLVRVRAASVNRLDWFDVTGTPWIARPITGLRGPKSRLIGVDFAGTSRVRLRADRSRAEASRREARESDVRGGSSRPCGRDQRAARST